MSSTTLQVLLSGVLQGLLYAIIGLGLYLVFSVMRVVNFAHGYLVLVGMYGVLRINPTGLGQYVLALLVVAAVAAVLGYLIQRLLIEPGLDKGGHSQLVITLSLGIIFQYSFQVWYPVPFGSIPNPWPWDAVQIAGATISVTRIAAGVMSLILMLAVSYLVYRTRAGSIMRGCSENLSGAVHVGVNVLRTYRLTFTLGAALAAVAGGLLLPIQPVSPLLGVELTIKAFIVVVIGGSGALWGTAVAGVLLGTAEALGSLYAPASLATSFIYLLFFLIILVRPQGIVPGVRTA
jgi:branched-chain amino acid transport system permease protein